jgi:hypothetical protein
MFAKGGWFIHHQVVCLALGQLTFPVAYFSLDHSDELKRVDQPQKWNEKCIDDEHDRFFFNNPVLICVDVMEGDSLYE